jgi:four helix bundle protein
MSGRLKSDLLERVTDFAVRVLKVTDQLELDRRPRRVIDQLIGSGTAPGANLFEAHEALSRKDFSKCVGCAAKELSETRFWLEVIARKEWFPHARITPLIDETNQHLSIVKVILARTKASGRRS